MAQISQKKLTEQLKMLKKIKPNEDWAGLLKSQILSEKGVNNVIIIEAQKASFANIFATAFSPKSLLYSCAVLFFLVAGFTGYLKIALPNSDLNSGDLAVNSQAALINQVSLGQNISDLRNNIESLTQVTKEGKEEQIPSVALQISQNVSQLAKTLKDKPIEDSKTINEIAMSLKVLADVQGASLEENSEIESLYKTIVESQIADFKKSTLTNEQVETLDEAIGLNEKGEYVEALELLLLINQ